MNLSLLRIERIRDASRIRAEYEAWKHAEPGEKRLPFLDPDRTRAIMAVMDGYCLRLQNLSTALERAIAKEQGEERILHAAGALFNSMLDAESTFQFFRYLLSFRSNLELGEPLQLAENCATDGYLALAVRAGIDIQRCPPPLVCPETMTSPAIFKRDSKLAAPGLDTVMAHIIPLPIVLVPPATLSSLWQQTALHHEIGHSLDGDLALGAQLAPHIDKLLAKAPEIRRTCWSVWLGEIIADLVAILLAGDAFAHTLAMLFDNHTMWASWSFDDDHPPPALRAALLARMVERRPQAIEGSVAMLKQRAEALPAQGKPFLGEADAIVDTLLDTPLRGGATLNTLIENPARDATLTSKLADALLSDDSLPPPECPRRLVPSAAQIALLRAKEPSEAIAEHIHTRAIKYLGTLPLPEWATSAQKWDFLRETVRTMTPTERDTEHGGIKRPPVRLLEQHEEISFVGATHDQLANALKRAHTLREKRKWKRLELFFLADSSLGWMARPERTMDELRNDKQRALQELSALLPEVAESWAILEYETPFFFASYWDVEVPEGRIHISPYAWGQDVRLCPSIDYLRGDSPTQAFTIYQHALENLRKTARSLAAG